LRSYHEISLLYENILKKLKLSAFFTVVKLIPGSTAPPGGCKGARHANRQKGLIGAATGDLKAIQRKVLDLGHDTGLWPNKKPAGSHVSMGSGGEVWDLSNPNAGLTANGGGFYPDWQGPYLTGPFKDPWGHNYFFDGDYNLDGRTVPVVGSFGPNGCCPNTYDDDNIVLIIPSAE